MKAIIFLLLSFCSIFPSCKGESKIRIADNLISIINIQDSTEIFINSYLSRFQNTGQLNFPNLTTSIYRQTGNRNIWFNNNDQEQLWKNAIKLLSCVAKFGLQTASYHSDEVNYDSVLGLLLQYSEKSAAKLKCRSDILLTDAMITLMVHLHFGKLNPYISLRDVDDEKFTGYRVDNVLIKTLKSPDSFQQSILSVQPKTAGYAILQNYLTNFIKLKGEECDDLSNDTAKCIAMNLERYKWDIPDDSIYIEINIPSFTLKFIDASKVKSYKVIVGKPVNATPIFMSKIDYLTTAPDWNIPNKIFRKEVIPKILLNPSYLDANNMAIYDRSGKVIRPTPDNLAAVRDNPSGFFGRQSPGCDNALGQIVFHFPNRFSVYLHDTPDRSLFDNKYRALSHGCIRIENAEDFAYHLLKVDSAPERVFSLVQNHMLSYTRYRYRLNDPITIITRYITCEIQNGKFIQYPDIYKKDRHLGQALFN